MNNNSYTAYSDESSYTDGQYRSIAMLSIKTSYEKQLNDKVSCLLNDSSISEFKWNKLTGAREKFAAIKLIDFIIEKINQDIMKIDVLIWDMSDSRHANIKKRDDIQNFQRMYYHLLNHVLNKQSQRESVWFIKPDEQSNIDWDDLKQIVRYSANKNKVFDFDPDNLKTKICQKFNLEEIYQVCSKSYPLVQVTDLLAGMGVYSRSSYDKYCSFLSQNSGQATLFPELEKTIQLSKSDKERCLVLEYLDKKCKLNKLQVSLKTHRGLRTLNKDQPLNFWWYIPQNPHDKAPIKSK